MICYVNGALVANRPLKNSDAKYIKNFWKTNYGQDVCVLPRTIEFKNFRASLPSMDFIDLLEDLLQILNSAGYELNGRLQFCGDYDEAVFVRNNDLKIVKRTDIGLETASDETLIKKLEARNWRVLSSDTLENLVAGAAVAGYISGRGIFLFPEDTAALLEYLQQTYQAWLANRESKSWLEYIENAMQHPNLDGSAS